MCIEVAVASSQSHKPRKNVQFVQEAEIMSPKFSSPPSSQLSSPPNLKASPAPEPEPTTPNHNHNHHHNHHPKRIILGDNSNDMGLNFERHEPDDECQGQVGYFVLFLFLFYFTFTLFFLISPIFCVTNNISAFFS